MSTEILYAVWDNFLGILKAIKPERWDPIWAAAIAASSAILSAYFTDRYARLRRKVEIAVERERAESERRSALRKEVYMPLFEHLHRSLGSLTALPFTNLDTMGQSNCSEDLDASLARMLAVASIEVVEASSIAVQEIRAAGYQLVVPMLNHHNLNKDIERLDRQIKEVLETSGDLKKESAPLCPNGPDPSASDRKGRDVAAELRRAIDLTGERLVTTRQMIETKFSNLDLALELCVPIFPLVGAAVIAMRKDLGMDFDSVWYNEFVIKSRDRFIGDIRRVKEQVKLELDQLMRQQAEPKC